MEKNFGLQLLVNYHRFTGASYLGWNFGRRMKIFHKLVIFTINIIMFMSTIYVVQSFTKSTIIFNKRKEHLKENRTMLIYILYITTSTSYSLLDLIVFFILLIKGKSIVELIYNDVNIDSGKELKIGKKILIGQIMMTMILESPFPICRAVFEGCVKRTILGQSIIYVSFIMMHNMQLTIISLLAYYSYSMEENIYEINTEFKSSSQLHYIKGKIIKLTNSLNRLNKYTNKYFFIVIWHNSLSCVTNFTIFYFDQGKRHGFALAYLFDSIIVTFTICYISNMLKTSYREFLQKIEMFEQSAISSQENLDNHVVARLRSIKNSWSLKALNFYELGSEFFLSNISSILTFVVILIQTN